MKKILLIMSAYTGHGHKSISDALMEQFSAMPGLEVRVLDGFELMGDLGLQMSKMYGPMTRYARHVWEASYNLSNRSAAVPESMVATASARRFLQILEEFEPESTRCSMAPFCGCWRLRANKSRWLCCRRISSASIRLGASRAHIGRFVPRRRLMSVPCATACRPKSWCG